MGAVGSALKTVGKVVAPIAASAIPGIGPIAGPLVAGAMGAIGKSGAQEGVKGAQQQQSQGTQRTQSEQQQTGRNESSGFQNAIEDPLFSAFRQSLLPALGQQIADINKPVYGDAQKATIFSDLNDLAKSATDNLTQQLARRGVLDSGALAGGLQGIELGRMSEASRQLAQLPLLNEQAKQAKIANVLGIATNFAGRAPLSQAYGNTTDINQVMRGQTDTQTEQDMMGTTSQTQQGAPWWKNMLNAGASVLGSAAANNAQKPRLPDFQMPPARGPKPLMVPPNLTPNDLGVQATSLPPSFGPRLPLPRF